jgi:signal peptidase I
MNEQNSPKQPKKGTIRYVLSAFLVALLITVLTQWLLFEVAFMPSFSMGHSIQHGEYVVVSKLHYGARLPITPLRMPLAGKKVAGSKIPAYSSALQLPYYRLPGLAQVQRGDVIAFNFPKQYDTPTDLREQFIGRCVALPGDTLAIMRNKLTINGTARVEPEELIRIYAINTDAEIDANKFYDHHIIRFERIGKGYELSLSNAQLELVKTWPEVKNIEELVIQQGYHSEDVYPFSSLYEWNPHYFGPLWLPEKGSTIAINDSTLALYDLLILHHEGLSNAYVDESNRKLYIDSVAVDEYTFRNNYYYVLSDNQGNMEDSHKWGPLPEDHIVGKATFVLYSKETNTRRKKRNSTVRWNRIGHIIR